MSLGKRLIQTGGAEVCNTESVQPFGADSIFSSNVATYQFENNANGVLTTTDLSTVNFPTGAGCIALYQLDSKCKRHFWKQ